MNRKDFIKAGVALGVGIPLLSLFMKPDDNDTGLPSESEVSFSGMVIIVGAGSAGLIAGYLLDKFNIDFQIVEASSVFGGRVRRLDGFADFPIDLGGEWIHEDPSVLARLTGSPSVSSEIEVITYNPDTIHSWANNELHEHNWVSYIYSEYKFKSTTWYGFFEKYIVPNIGNRIIYDCPVTQIDYSNEKVVIKNAAGDDFHADKVLVTVPIKMLQQESISFVPDLPLEKKAAIDSVEMPEGMKVFIEFSERFYPDILFTGSIWDELNAADKLFYDAAFGKDSNKNILGLFVVGEKASVYTSLNNDAEIIEAVIAELHAVYNGKASETYLKHVVQNWSKEPFIQGSYSSEFSQSESETIGTLLEPLEGRIFFAGEALSLDNRATVPGAGESAYSAIERMLVE